MILTFNREAYRKRYELNSILLDPISNKTYNVCRRNTTKYRPGTYKYLNINRIPAGIFASTLLKGQPLMLYNDGETFLLTMYHIYPPAKKWQNITCRILKNALEYCEVLEKWQTLHPPTTT